jgi:hypothetical protein
MADVERVDGLGSFVGIAYALPHDVEFVQTSVPYIELDGDEEAIERVVIEVEDQTLHVKSKKDTSWGWGRRNHDLKVEIGYDTLEAISMAGSGDGRATSIVADDFRVRIAGSAGLEIDGLETDGLTVAVAGSGEVDITDLDAESVSTSIAGSGNVTITGKTQTQSVAISGSGDHDARDLQSNVASASIRGSGDVVVWANDELDAAVMGSGDIDYYGDAKVSSRIMGSGDLRHRGTKP